MGDRKVLTIRSGEVGVIEVAKVVIVCVVVVGSMAGDIKSF